MTQASSTNKERDDFSIVYSTRVWDQCCAMEHYATDTETEDQEEPLLDRGEDEHIERG